MGPKIVSLTPSRETPGTRSQLIESGLTLFSQRGFDHVTVSEIALSVNAYPNQITHHFGGKEGLFVEAACRGVLRAAKKAEQRTRRSETPEDHTRALVSYLLGPADRFVMMFAEAMLMGRRSERLQTLVHQTLDLLHEAGEAAMVDTFMRTGWTAHTSPDAITRGFWAAIFGLAVQKAATGMAFEYANAEAVVLMMLKINTPDPD
ncbi:TetR/AcrR family transcriptional regulator C-terminal domain-containing protein [Tistrella mobilis]|uniref:TetR/AcrR family transcriptional regulator C-terminal domain-containing protein n=1 Tax=Tistrella mobilis TaxID=171437 RepID=UPI00355913F1